MVRKYSGLSEEERTRFTEFQEGVSFWVPRGTGYAFVIADEFSSNGHEEYIGVLTSTNGEKGFRRRDRAVAFRRTCSSFIGEHAGVPSNAVKVK